MSAAELLNNLTPGEAGILASTLEGCDALGDDDTVETLASVIEYEKIATGNLVEHAAYYIVHGLKRQIPGEYEAI